MTADWKEPEKLAESLIVDSDSDDEAVLDAETSQVSEPAGLQPGDIFAGHYEILGVLGHGGMSTVYKAKHLLVNSVRAIKVIRSEQADNSKVLRRFQQEGQAALTLEHPNIGRVYEFGIEPTLQKPFLVMDFVEGKTLAATLAEDGALGTERAARLIAQVCDGLQEAHTKGVIHRDIKPGNIILTKDASGSEVAKIVDFGIAKLIGRESEQNLTQTGEVFGTPLYMSPEQCQGMKVDERSDIYSLGCVLHECLTGQPPFQGESPFQTIMMHVDGKLPQFNNVPHGLQSVILKALERQPDKRYKNSIEFKNSLLDASNSPDKLATKVSNLSKIASKKTNWNIVILMILFVAALSSVAHKIWLDNEMKDLRRQYNFVQHGQDVLSEQRLNPEAWKKVAKDLELKGEHELAEKAHRRALSLQLVPEKRTDPSAWTELALSQEKENNLADAERAYRKAIQIKADYKQAWIGLGQVLQKEGKSADSADALKHADAL